MDKQAQIAYHRAQIAFYRWSRPDMGSYMTPHVEALKLLLAGVVGLEDSRAIPSSHARKDNDG